MGDKPLQGMWALILGASSGFGGATVVVLSHPAVRFVSGSSIFVDGGESAVLRIEE